MAILETMWKLVDAVVSDLKCVTIDYDSIKHTCTSLETWKKGQQVLCDGEVPLPSEVKHDMDLFMFYLIADSVNFCYWYGSPKWRPGGSSSTKLEDLLSQVFYWKHCQYNQRPHWKHVVDMFQRVLSNHQFPLLPERRQLLQEIEDIPVLFSHMFTSSRTKITIDQCLQHLVWMIPGYSGDQFLKRASLFFLELWKRRRLIREYSFDPDWSNQIKGLPVPIDYHIPNVLRYLGCIHYNKTLSTMISDEQLIPKGSRMEVEIRAASAYVCQAIGKHTNITPDVIDAFLFQQKEVARSYHPFHLTITTDY